MKLTQAFYHRDTRLVAQALLGKYLVRFQDGLPLVVRIQETEAYIGRMDKACHAYNYRRTPRTETLFAPPGTAYIYLIYGMYHCLNFVTEPEGEPCAVLIRGGQPRGSLSFLARLGAAVCLSEKEFSQRAGQTLPGSGAHPGGEWLLPAGRQSLCLRPAGGSRTHHAA